MFENQGEALIRVLIALGTLPYYRFFEFNTLGVIKRVSIHCSQPEEFSLLVRVLARWRHRKLAELQYISIACAILLGAVIGTFSWNNVAEAYWLCRAFWYISMVLSVLGILLAAQQVAVLNFLGDLPKDADGEYAHTIVSRYLPLLISVSQPVTGRIGANRHPHLSVRCKPKKKMIFVWQCPTMFMSYSVCFFLLGLTMLVVTPLIRIGTFGWTPDCTVAIIYLGTSAIAGAAFAFCAFWIYHYIDLGIDSALHHDRNVALTKEPNRTRKQTSGPPRGSVGEEWDVENASETHLQEIGDNVDYTVERQAALIPRADSFNQ